MPRVIEKLVYKYDELSERAKEKVHEWYVSSCMDYDWYEYTIDDLKSQGPEKGLDVDEINFSGFYSQGDYASWNGSIRLLDFLDAHLTPENPDYARYLILRDLIDDDWVQHRVSVSNRQYRGHVTTVEEPEDYTYRAVDEPDVLTHGMFKGVNVEHIGREIDIDDLLSSLHEWMQTEAGEYARRCYKQLEEEYEWLCSPEQIADACKHNEWEFDEDGRTL
jgi:hypothetical protein